MGSGSWGERMWEGGGVEGSKTGVRKYCMREESIFNKN